MVAKIVTQPYLPKSLPVLQLLSGKNISADQLALVVERRRLDGNTSQRSAQLMRAAAAVLPLIT